MTQHQICLLRRHFETTTNSIKVIEKLKAGQECERTKFVTVTAVHFMNLCFMNMNNELGHGTHCPDIVGILVIICHISLFNSFLSFRISFNKDIKFWAAKIRHHSTHF